MNTFKQAFLWIISCLVLLMAALAPSRVSAATDITKKPEITVYVGNVRNLNPGEMKGKKTWSSDQKKIVSVAKRGIITAKKKGEATITVTNGKATLTCKVNVLPVKMKTKKATVLQHNTIILTLLCGTKKGVTWESSDPSVLSYLSGEGKTSEWRAETPGSAVVTATYNGKSYTTAVTVEADKDIPTPTPVPTGDREDTLLPETT